MQTKINPNFPNHLIYSDGKVYSLRLKRFMKIDINSNGYARYSIMGNNKKVFAHHLIMSTFGPEKPKHLIDPTVDHIDGNKLNNNIDNLRWLSKKENTARHNPEKISQEKIKLIKKLYSTGKYSYRKIARELNIGCHHTVKRYAH